MPENNARFLKTCQEIEKKSERATTFSFLTGADAANKQLLEKVLKSYLEDFVVHRLLLREVSNNSFR